MQGCVVAARSRSSKLFCGDPSEQGTGVQFELRLITCHDPTSKL